MWLKREIKSKKLSFRKKLSYSRYYEHDGALRAYANRAMVLAFLCVPAHCWRSVLQFTCACSPPRSSAWTQMARQES